MEYVFEFLTEVLLECASEAISCKKIPRYIRYPLTAFVILFVGAVIGGLMLAGITLFPESRIGGCIIIGIASVFAVLAVREFRKALRSDSSDDTDRKKRG